MTATSLRNAASEAFEALEANHWIGDKLNEATLVTAMRTYITEHHAKRITLERTRLLDSLCKRTVADRIHGSRPSAADIRRIGTVVNGALPLFDHDMVMNEIYRLPNGKTVRLADMTLTELRSLTLARARAVGDEQTILSRLRLIEREMERHGIDRVGDLFKAI